MGQAAEPYNKGDLHVLDRFDRQIVFVKPDLFLIRDTLSAPEAHTYSFMLHVAADGEFEFLDDGIHATSTGCYLQTHVFSPGGVTYSSGSLPGAERYGPYLAATTRRSTAATVTTALIARKHSKLIANTSFENGMAAWRPRRMPGFIENHVIDSEVSHSGQASARIDNGGYYYSRQFAAAPGTRISVKFWARCTADQGAESILYYWKGGKSFALTRGPSANVDEWRQYEFEDVVPEDTEEVCLALQFFGEGQCWYDDVELTTDQPVEHSEPATVTPIEEGRAGCVVVLDGVTHVLLCGEAGQSRTVEAAGHTLSTDADLSVVSLRRDGARAFVRRGATLTLDGGAVEAATGEWRAGELP